MMLTTTFIHSFIQVTQAGPRTPDTGLWCVSLHRLHHAWRPRLRHSCAHATRTSTSVHVCTPFDSGTPLSTHLPHLFSPPCGAVALSVVVEHERCLDHVRERAHLHVGARQGGGFPGFEISLENLPL